MQRLHDEEWVSRHLIKKEHFKKDPNREGYFLVKKDAFQPRLSKPDPQTGKRSIPDNDGVSVTSHAGLSSEELIDCGLEVIGLMSDEGRRGKVLYGRAELKVGEIRSKVRPLDVWLTPQNGGRNHADILNWPSPVQAIAELNELMTDLATLAGEPILYETPIPYPEG